MRTLGRPKRIDYLALAIVSMATLTFEVLLLRVFSYSQWHHFASLAISLALLGFGAAGTLLAVLGKRIRTHYDQVFLTGLIIGAVGMLLTSLLPHFIIVRPLFAVWDPAELAKLLILDFSAFIPFFGMALCIGLVFIRWPESTRQLYGVNLLGSGLGALVASLLLAFFFLESVLLVMPAALLTTAALFCRIRLHAPWPGLACLVGAALLGLWMGLGPPQLPLSDFKRLAYLLDLPDSQVLERQSGLQAEVSIVRAESIRIAPGLSLRWPDPVPSTDALVLDSELTIPLPDPHSIATPQPHFQAMLASLPFLLRPNGPLAILGTSEWLIPSRVGSRQAVWVEHNPHVSGSFHDRGLPQTVEINRVDPRGFLSSGFDKYSLIYFAQSFNEGDSASEDYLLTQESIASSLGKLEPGGLLAIPMPISYPPRQVPRLLATVAAALKASSPTESSRHVALLRSMQEGLLLVSRDFLTPEDLQAIRTFSTRWEFDIAALPDLQASETNRFHHLPEPVFFLAAQAFLSDSGTVPPSATWFSLTVPTDSRPYFWKSMQWRKAPKLIHDFGRAGLVWLDWALVMTAINLIVAGFFATALIILPLGKLPRAQKPLTRPRILLFFSALGFGFMLVELAAFQRCILFLVDPVVTASLVFSIFLIGAGLGSMTAPKGKDRYGPITIFSSILATGFLAFLLLHFGQDSLSGLPAWMRMGAIAAFLAPLTWAMGAAFPWGLRQLDEDRSLIPWAWGINGFASVIAAQAATLLSVHLGQPVTWLAGGLCYLLAWLIARSWARQWGWY